MWYVSKLQLTDSFFTIGMLIALLLFMANGIIRQKSEYYYYLIYHCELSSFCVFLFINFSHQGIRLFA